MLYANTDEGSSALWVLDGNGVVIDNISYSIADRTPILAQINEHYGTSFTGWSDNEISLRVGETIPNWSAYEKIENPEFHKTLIAWSFNPNGFPLIAGYVGKDNINIYHAYLYHDATWENGVATFETDGRRITPGVQEYNWFAQNLATSILNELGVEMSSIILIDCPVETGEFLQNWENYQKLQ